MLIISNNCSGAYLYKKLKCQFNNPFMWMICPYESFYYLMNNFDKINWEDYEFTKSKLKENTFCIKIENKIELHFVHHIWDKTKTSLLKLEESKDWPGEIRYAKIYEYINEKYIERVKRMIAYNEKPTFLIKEDSFGNESSKISPIDFCQNDKKYKTIILTSKDIQSTNDYTKIIKTDDSPLTILVDNFQNDITSFLT